ncbi:MAG: SpoIIE family protein phosphatase [Planctomycetota bacterium]
MSIRTKFLVLLLGLVLGLSGIYAVVTLAQTKDFARQIGTDTREELSKRGRSELTGIVRGLRGVLGANKWGAEVSLLATAERAGALLRSGSADAPTGPYRGGDPIFADRLGADAQLVPPATGSDLFDPATTLDREVFFAPPDSNRARLEREARALVPLVETLRALDSSTPANGIAFGVRSIVLESGLFMAFPGTTVLPSDFDARSTPWYVASKRLAQTDRGASLAEGPVFWNRLYTDPVTTRVVMTGTVALRDAEGGFLGVAAVDIPVDSVLTEVDTPQAYRGATATRLVIPIPPDVTDAERRDLERKIRVRTGTLTDADDELITAGGLMVLAARFPADTDDLIGAPDPDEALERLAPGVAPALLDIDRIIAKGEGAQGVKDLVAAMLSEEVGTRVVGDPASSAAEAWAWGRIDRETFITLTTANERLVTEATALRDKFSVETERRLIQTVVLAVALAAAAVFLAIVLSRRLVRPLLELRGVAERVAAGDFEARATVRTGDEIERLGETFNQMVPQLADRIRLRDSMGVAMDVQQHLLPSAPPKLPGLEIFAKSIYCDETGGDYFDFVTGNGERRPRTVVAVGDVTGHGVGAALVMASARAILRSHAAIDDDLASIAGAMNEQLFHDSLDGRFMTLFAMEIDAEGGGITWVSAGHEPALLYDPGTDTFEQLDAKDIPLGVEPGWAFKSFCRPALAPGQVLLVATDGIGETRNASGELFGADRLRELVRSHAKKPIEDLYAALETALDVHRGPRPQQDDITLVVIRSDHVPSEVVSADVDPAISKPDRS